MTEVKWQTSTFPVPMLDFLRGKASDRKLRLFGVASCRQVWQLLAQSSREAVEIADLFADGLVSAADLASAHEATEEAWRVSPHFGEEDYDADLQAAVAVTDPDAWLSAASTSWIAAWHPNFLAYDATGRASRNIPPELGFPRFEEVRQRQSHLLRCMVGNPFCPRPRRSFPSHIRALAQRCYTGDGSAYRVLGDALLEFGEETAVTHCREKVHVKGCHLVDWVLEKE